MKDIYVAPKQKGKKKNPQIAGGINEPHMNILSAFSKDPKGISFQEQEKDESVILFLRPHFLTNLSWILFTVVLIFLLPVITILLPVSGVNFLSSSIVMHFLPVYVIFYYLIVFSYAFINFLTWFYNIFLVTPDRIVDINYYDIVVHDVSETKLNQIEDVRYNQSGFIPTLFNYGNLYAQTAGERENFEANSIPKPKEATDIIAGFIGGKE
jgi:hypothetical protein